VRFLGGIAVLLLLTGCARQSDTLPPGVPMEDVPDQETWDIALSLSMDGQPRALVRAPYLARYERADSTFARFGPTAEDTSRVAVRVYDDGQPTATVESDRLIYFDEERRFVAEGRVVVQTETGKTLRSESLTWDEAERSLRTDGFVRITTPTERLQGYQLVADEGLETYTLARITGQVEVEE
jgi:LPS export ABC transporter protein LptC